MPELALSEEVLEEFCRRHAIRSLALFGSRLHGDARPDSDLDLLVEFAPEQRVGLFALAEMEAELTAMLGWRVDLRTASELSHYFRPSVLCKAEVLYSERESGAGSEQRMTVQRIP